MENIYSLRVDYLVHKAVAAFQKFANGCLPVLGHDATQTWVAGKDIGPLNQAFNQLLGVFNRKLPVIVPDLSQIIQRRISPSYLNHVLTICLTSSCV